MQCNAVQHTNSAYNGGDSSLICRQLDPLRSECVTSEVLPFVARPEITCWNSTSLRSDEDVIVLIIDHVLLTALFTCTPPTL